MNGLHDLGGVDGLGPIHPTPAEPPFHAQWEKTAHSLMAAGFLAGYFGIDALRYGIELMDPREYLSSPYYLHWVRSVEHHAIAAGAIDPEELDRRTRHYLEHPDAALPEHEPNPKLVEVAEAAVLAGASARRPLDTPPAFAVGDVVRVDDPAPFGHTRRARYVRGKVGAVIAYRGSFVYPDTAAAGLGEDPQHVYTILFAAQTLWGQEYAEPNTSTTFDVWEPYIAHAPTAEGASA
jgi:nitrile hydratase